MATTTSTYSKKSPSFFNFLKEGLLLPTHNRRLFAAVFAMIVASRYLLPLGNHLAIQPFADEIGIHGEALNGIDPGRSRENLHLIQEIMDDTRKLLIANTVNRLVSMSIGSVTQIVTLFAAVATYSGGGELLTFASLLGKAKTQMKGPLLTLAFSYALEIGYSVLLQAMVRLHTFLMIEQYLVLLLIGSLLVIIACIFVVYFSFMCSMSIVVAVAEPGCHGAGAVGRAWRLMKGKVLRVVLFIVVTVLLDAAIWPVLSKMASGLLLGFLHNILMAATQVFDVCTKTAFYYECKGAPRHRLPWYRLPKKRSIDV